LYVGGLLNPLNFNPATTGFWDFIDMATLITSRSQKFTVSPFHFIPRDAGKVAAKDYRTVPAVLNDGSYISGFLEQAKAAYLAADSELAKKNALMLIGMRLHTFADTYAHRLFSGYNENCNNVQLQYVRNNINGADETEQYESGIADWLKAFDKILPGFAPKIGHMMIAHVPDLAHLSFIMLYPTPGGKMERYERSNTEEFITAGREIYNFLLGCLGKPNVNDGEWNGISQNLTKAFLIDVQDSDEAYDEVNRLILQWSKYFPDYIYTYDRKTVFGGVLGYDEKEIGEYLGDDFFAYNAYADELLIALYGSQPRASWFNETIAAQRKVHGLI
jgi:hypothetical protein